MIDPADKLTTPLAVTSDSPLCLRFASAGRMYVAVLEQDLLNDWVVVQSWGGRFSARGGGKIAVMADREAGLALLRQITQQRMKRGYTLLK